MFVFYFLWIVGDFVLLSFCVDEFVCLVGVGCCGGSVCG